jgi:hypothetical protein
MTEERLGLPLRTETVEVFSDATNAWVVRTPGRRFPALVIQGDTLSTIHDDVLSVKAALDEGRQSDVREEIDWLEERLRGYLAYYQDVLDKRGCELPYANRREAPSE